MGSDPGTDPNAQPDEQPQHHVCLTNGFWLDEFDVTNAAFDAFVQAGGYNDDSLWSADGLNWKQTNNINGPETDCGQYSSRPNQPRICVNYYEAEAYAKWRGGMLPTEAEHEYAARGTDARIYPWGNNFQPGRVNTSDAPIGKPSNVDAYPAGRSWVGAYDMSGNVWNWVRDWYDANYYAVSPQNDPLGATTSQFRALRGGSWLESFIYTRAAVRHPHAPVRRGTNIGFRVVLPG
jgi:formylglycine-generating enzyme required for sulfatase activity